MSPTSSRKSVPLSASSKRWANSTRATEDLRKMLLAFEATGHGYIQARLESMVRGQDFDPQRSQERFRLAVTDHVLITLIPPLIRRIRSAAPDIRLEVSQWQDRAYEA